jgi:pilus assembly protein Flp/PilA
MSLYTGGLRFWRDAACVRREKDMQNLERSISGPAWMQAFWRKLYRDIAGQDMIEYALMAAFVAVASAAVIPSANSAISTVFSKVGSVLVAAASS